MFAATDLRTFFGSRRLVAAVVLAAFATWLLCWQPFAPEEASGDPSFLELTAICPADGSFSARIDEGHGFATNRPSNLVAAIKGAPDAASVRLRLPAGRI